jgi:branched-chain amino acid transport system substrate-binding protein
MSPAQSAKPAPGTTGEPFTVQVSRTGRIGLLERGRAEDVPTELLELARRVWPSDVTSCRFVWLPASKVRPYAVTLTLDDGDEFAHVVLDAEPLDELPFRMSPREMEVLSLLVAGMSNAEIAAALWISAATAAAHVNKVLQKTELPSRTAAATYALDAGLLHVPLPGEAAQFAHLAVGRLLAAPAEDDGDRADPPAPWRPAGAPRVVVNRTRPRELVVGAILPTTGKGSDDGIEMRNGLQLAIEEINGAGGIRGRTVRAAVANVDVTSSASISASFESLLAQGVDVLTSGYLADQEVAHRIAARSGVPYLHAATSGSMEQVVREDLDNFRHVFQVCASDTMYAPTFVNYMTRLRDSGQWESPSQRLVILKKGWRHVDFGIERALVLAVEQGWQLDVIPVEGPENGDGWMRAVVTALREPAAAAMIGSYFTAYAVQAIAAMRVSGAPTLAYAIYAPSIPEFRHQLGASADGVLWATMTGTYSDSIGTAFARRYRHRFGMSPGRSHAGIAYDRMQRIALAWRLTGDLSDGDAVADSIRAQPYRGVNGTYNFDTPGQTARAFEDEMADPSLAQPQLIFQIQQGRQVIVDGGPFRTGEFQLTEPYLAARR